MLPLTRQEKQVILITAVIIFSGSLINHLFKKYPFLYDSVNLIDSQKIYPKIDLNTASFDELVALPYIGNYTANQIIHYRQMHESFRSVEEVKQVKGIKEKNYQKFSPYLMVEVEP